MKNLQNKNFAVTIAVVLLLTTGVLVALNNQKGTGKNETEKAEDKAAPVETPATAQSAGTGVINDVTLTVYINNQATTSLDGKTTIPSGSISPYFYVPAGIYSVQKLSGTNWIDVASNINYSGSGGLSAQPAGPAEDNISYRVLRLENGTVKDISRTFMVKRSELASGFKTYN